MKYLVFISIFIIGFIQICFGQNNEGKFIADFFCNKSVKGTVDCDKLKETINAANELLSQAFSLRNDIRINVTVMQNNVMPGVAMWADPVWKEGYSELTNLPIRIPQGLARQSVKWQNVELQKYDGNVFVPDGNNYTYEILKNGMNSIQTNPESHASSVFSTYIHELFHALGFISAVSDFTVPIKADYLIPDEKIQPVAPNIFDQWIFTSKYQVPIITTIKDLINWKRENPTANLTDSGYQKELEMSKSFYELVKTDSPAIYFKANSKNYILYTSKKFGFIAGSSVSHFDYKFSNQTEDVVMIPSNSFIDHSWFKEDWKYYPIGPGMMEVMKTLGYPTFDNPENEPKIRF